ncbi:MAG: N-acetyl-gamma-glutamyl-phosphate reductase [Actinomycetota bacterium]
MGATATVLGGSGYSGGELLRLLADHPGIDVRTVAAGRHAGAAVAAAHPHLARLDASFLRLEEAVQETADVCFACLPAGELGGSLAALEDTLVIDLSDSFRGDDAWAYGLTEYARERVRTARRVANPGCYSTAALLALLPFAAAGVVEGPIVIDALSGLSGAGRSAEDRLLFAGASGSAMAYGTTSHRHVPEIERALGLWGGVDVPVSFTPHLVPMPRGLLATVRARLKGSLDETGAVTLLAEAYASEPFVTVIADWPQTKAVAGSNHAHVTARVDERSGFVVVSCAIDNLGKGAAGQAIQNANLMLDLDETTGLTGIGVWP